MKSLSTYLKDNSLNERLIINKNFKGGKANIEFYDKFSNFLSSKSDLGWFDVYHIKDAIPTGLSDNNETASNKIKQFFSDNYIKYILGVVDADPYEDICELYYDILKFIDDNKDDMEFIYINEPTNRREYLTYLFEAGKIKVGIWGYETVVVGERSPHATIAFQYI